MKQIECVVNAANKLGEGSTWSARDQALYWVDSRAPAIHRLNPSSGEIRSVSLPSIIGSFGLRKKGGMVVALQTGFHFLDFDTGALTAILDPEDDIETNRMNDGRCDRQGRFWAGSMNDTKRDPDGSLYRLDPDLSCTKIRDDIIVPNALAWSPDSKAMYFADTYREHILVYDFHADEGTISNPRLFADLRGKGGRPDGATVDADGCLWNATYAGGRVVRYTPDGRIDQVIEMPVSQPSCCCFGGRDLDTLYITSATQRLTPEQLAQQPLAGGLFAVKVGVKGLPEPEFLG